MGSGRRTYSLFELRLSAVVRRGELSLERGCLFVRILVSETSKELAYLPQLGELGLGREGRRP